MDISRRNFLRGGGLVVLTAAGTKVGLNFFTPGGQLAAAATMPDVSPLPSGTPILVLVDMQGGNDATNMVINPEDPYYYDYSEGHGRVAIPHAQILKLDGTGFGLNPSMPWLAKQYSKGKNVALVLGPGENVVNSFSHFDAMHYRQVADFTGTAEGGWLGRYNDIVNPANPFASVSFVGVHPCLLGEDNAVLSVANVADFDFSVGWQWETGWLSAWQSMGTGGSLSGTTQEAAVQNIADTFTCQSSVYGAADSSIASQFGTASVEQQLLQAAQLIGAGIPCQTYVVTLYGFDTHDDENDNQSPLLAQIDRGLKSFFEVIDAGPRAGDVFVLFSSEFGRQETANASIGCDHGQAGTDIIVGGGVVGGLYGEFPDTDPAARLYDALVPTVDFRCVYSTILNRLSGNTSVSETVLLEPFEDLGFFG